MTLRFVDEDLDRLTTLVVTTLAKCGQARECQDGHVQTVAIGRRGLTPSGMFLLKVDTERLPRGVFVENLVSPRIVHQLAAVTHHPVDVLNTTGVTYVIHLGAPGGRPALPRSARLQDVLPAHPGTPLAFPLGVGPDGPVWGDLAGHYLVGGETGAGKTTFLLATLLALTATTSPAELQLVVVDPKAVDFAALTGAPHLARPIATEVPAAAEAVAWLVERLEERRRLFLQALARDLDGYNRRAVEKLPYLLAVVDEVTDLALQAGVKSRFYRDLVRLSSIGRSFGLRLILATQNPKAEVLDTLIKGNLAARIAFRVTTPEHSRVILGQSGAEKLPRIPGRLLARLGDGRLQELQGYGVTEEELATLGRPAEPLALLDAETRAMRQHALEQLSGRFPQDELMAAGWTRPQYRQAVVKLRQAGLLEGGPGVALTVH
ncbi:MAG: DNA translocase FtsK [Anaerolineae bacterium]|nr:DNA translocase FtsK [Anaerolineae bacterium]